MKVSYNWLSEYLDLNTTNAQDLAEQITLTGIEVDTVYELGKGLDGLVIGKILSCESMEGSDHLNVAAVNIGDEAPVQIVCGAPNVKAGQSVIVAKPGTILPGGMEIRKSQIRGVESNGMICSLDELGFSDSVIPKYAEKGIFVITEEAVPGEDARPYVGLDDPVIELEITPNRADAMSMRGVAYETGAILFQEPQLPSLEIDERRTTDSKEEVSIAVEDPADTIVYKMRLVKDVTVKASPLWLQRKLMNAGIRPIDNIVDVTNYILLEYGQPLHAFDYDKLGSDEIFVRRAKEGERLITLDGHERKLTPENLVITNGEIPVALAGVMGGGNSHVSKDTSTIAIESAVFKSALIRKTASELHLRSESSARFERGINLATVQRALDHAAQLMAELGNGTTITKTAEVVNEVPQDMEVSISLETLNKKIGITLSEEEVSQVWNRLDFKYEVVNGVFTVFIPPRRWDISIEADLIEEVARIYGYKNIPSTLPTTESVPGELNEKQRLTRFIRGYLEGSGLSQAISYALTTPNKAQRFTMEEEESIQLNHPMSEEHQTLRQTIISGLVDDAAYNSARQQPNVALYEMGHVFYKEPDEAVPREENHVGGLITGSLHEKSWIEEAWPIDFYSIKGIVEELFARIGIDTEKVKYEAHSDLESMHPGRTALVKLEGEVVGLLGQIHPTVAEESDLADTYVFEINMDALVAAEKDPVVFHMTPKYPGTSRDIALVVDEAITNEQVVSIIKANSGKWLQKVTLFDLYQGENIEQGQKSMAYSLSYLNPEATLKEEEVNKEFDHVRMALQKEINAEIR